MDNLASRIQHTGQRAKSKEQRARNLKQRAESEEQEALSPMPYALNSVLYALFRLARPLNGVIVFISVFLGAFLAKGSISTLINVVIAAIAAFLLSSAGNAFNDFYDVETDRINKPSRPIPSGQVKRRSALMLAVVLFAIGTGLGLLINWLAFIVACVVSGLLVFYTIKLRQLSLTGNMVIGLLTGLAFIWGGIAVETRHAVSLRAVIPAVFAFLFTSGREIVKDIQDIRGDKAAGLLSLSVKWGQRKAMYASFIFLALVILISPFPYLLGTYSLYYLICVVLGVDLVLIYCMTILLTGLTKQNAARVANLMKFDIFIGLGAIYLGGL